MTVARVVARNVRERPDAVAFAEVTAGPQLTWREYDEQSDRIAGALRRSVFVSFAVVRWQARHF